MVVIVPPTGGAVTVTGVSPVSWGVSIRFVQHGGYPRRLPVRARVVMMWWWDGRFASAAGEHPVAQAGEGSGQQPGDLHLGYPDLGGDLGLGHVGQEAQGEDAPFLSGKLGEQEVQGFACVDGVDCGIRGAERVDQRQLRMSQGGSL